MSQRCQNLTQWAVRTAGAPRTLGDGTVLICINAEPEAVEHDQATRLPDACRWRSRRVAGCGARAAADAAGDRVSEQHVVRPVRALRGRIPAGPERNRLCPKP